MLAGQGSLGHLVGADVEQHGARQVSEPRRGPELVAWGRGQWVTPFPSADGRAHLFRACVPTCVALGRAPGRRWRGRLALGCERCHVGSTCWVHSTASESEAWFPRPLALWLLGSVGPETCGPHGCRKQHLRLPFRPPGPIFPQPRLREWGRQGGLCLYPRVLEESFPSPPGPPHSLYQPFPV